uniref:Uncharacterized protein n=1 Tax=Myotis myotis TaxID=51298 RepID=A0A7J7XHF5_MYOMY|nr:hypothetical protein mMyoMyo1_011656 [Myotis myotis]
MARESLAWRENSKSCVPRPESGGQWRTVEEVRPRTSARTAGRGRDCGPDPKRNGEPLKDFNPNRDTCVSKRCWKEPECMCPEEMSRLWSIFKNHGNNLFFKGAALSRKATVTSQ